MFTPDTKDHTFVCTVKARYIDSSTKAESFVIGEASGAGEKKTHVQAAREACRKLVAAGVQLNGFCPVALSSLRDETKFLPGHTVGVWCVARGRGGRL